ncbi:hypothetical protein KAZ82_00760 [Candidatus Babeliales bacterium]|nr:hypothetical protein [Candidatus Babeliales bacterium]
MKKYQTFVFGLCVFMQWTFAGDGQYDSRLFDAFKEDFCCVNPSSLLAKVETLIFSGADVNAVKSSDDSQSVLTEAILRSGGNSDKWVLVIERLITAGADVNARNGKGLLPLYYATIHGLPNERLIALLLKNSADPNESMIPESPILPDRYVRNKIRSLQLHSEGVVSEYRVSLVGVSLLRQLHRELDFLCKTSVQDGYENLDYQNNIRNLFDNMNNWKNQIDYPQYNYCLSLVSSIYALLKYNQGNLVMSDTLKNSTIVRFAQEKIQQDLKKV